MIDHEHMPQLYAAIFRRGEISAMVLCCEQDHFYFSKDAGAKISYYSRKNQGISVTINSYVYQDNPV